MARIRTVKPSTFKNEDLAELPALDRLTFIGLWTQADRRGRMEDRPKRLKAELLPYDDCDIDAILQRLNQSGFIVRYESEGKRLIQVCNFEKHQRITGSESETESEFAAPVMELVSKETQEDNSGNTDETPRTTGREGKGRERKGREEDAAGAASPPPEPKAEPTPSDFLEAWNEAVPFSPIRSMSETRKTALRARRADPGWQRDWRAALGRVRGSPFLRGENDRNWKADVDFFLRPDTVTKILEGKYDGGNGKHKQGDGRVATDAGTIAKIKYFDPAKAAGSADIDTAEQRPPPA